MTLRRRFSEEFKAEAVKLATRSGVSTNAAARDLGIHESVLRRWVRNAEQPLKVARPDSGAAGLIREVTRLQRENARLKMERDIIKKALGYFAKDPR